MSNNELGSKRDQEIILPLLIAGRSYRECMSLLGWRYGRVSEAARATNGAPSDSRDGRALRAKSKPARSNLEKQRAVTERLRAFVESRRSAMAESL